MSEAISTTVILGAGQAGGETALALRQLGYSGRIVLAGSETHLPYRRPPLSKAFLAGQADEASLLIRPADAWEKAEIDVRLGVTATAIVLERGRVVHHGASAALAADARTLERLVAVA